MKYRKKPVVIEAFRLGIDCIPDWFMEKAVVGDAHIYGEPPEAKIKTLEGVMTANYGDFIIKGVKGEVYPCKSDIFYATYEEKRGHGTSRYTSYNPVADYNIKVQQAKAFLGFSSTADVVEVIHGEWITPKSRDADDWKECSRCGYCFDVSVGHKPTPYCPNCGAKMDGDRREE